MENKKFQRSVAKKININHIINSKFIKGNDDEASHFLTTNDKKIYRFNLIAIVINKEIHGSIQVFSLDDGTGTIISRFFEENKNLEKINVGDVVLIIGKLREFNDEKYISPEIISKIDTDWLKLRSLELKTKPLVEIKKSKEVEITEKNKEPIKEEVQEKIFEVIEKEEEEPKFPIEKLVDLIKSLDSGEGVSIEEILEKSSMDGTEKLIDKMLENGDIFQNQPGKVKVL